MIRWAIWWQQANDDAGHFMADGGNYLLFKTKKAAKTYIRVKYDYIAYRPDLRKAPYFWRMPQAIKVKVGLEEV